MDDWVTHVIAPTPLGGAESVVRALARGRQGCVDVAALMQTVLVEPFVNAARKDGIPVSEITCGRRRYFAEARALAAHLRQRGSSVLHSHVYHADVVGYLATRRCRIPIVSTVHGFVGGSLKNRMYEMSDRALLRNFDAVICVSETVREQVIDARVPERKTYLIPNCLDPRPTLDRSVAREILGIENTSAAIGWIGRLSNEKGPDLLLDALPHLELPCTTTVFIGDGPDRPQLDQRSRSGTLSKRAIKFVGRRDDAAALMSALDVLVISSRTEGTPMVLLEAIAARIPVVAFAVGGIPRVISQESGWLVTPGNIAELAAAIENAVTDRSEAQRRTTAAHDVLESLFGYGSWIERINEVYKTVLGRST